jgi:hypothetical protein
MPDYDVGAINLSVPPASAVLQQYRPAVLVRNNGVHDALASGTLRIYGPAGLLIFTTEIYSGTIAPGNSEPAQATDYWTPPAIGRYQVIAYVSCPLDQYEPNNNLAPCFVNVTGAPPPPAPTVPLHAAQHEDGGSDELNADGLRGKLADAQTALAHKTSHQVAGSDTLDLTGMLGVLGTPQPIADHHLTHEHGGGDRLYVGGLNGQLADCQPALIHDNAKHDPNYTTVTEFGNHLADTTKVHELATNLEQVPNKGKPGHYPELDEYGHVPAAQLGIETTPPRPDDAALLHNNTWDYPPPAVHDNDLHAVNYEDRANKGVAEGYAPLDGSGYVPTANLGALGTSPPVPSPNVLHDDQCFYESAPALHSTSHQDGGGDEISIAGLVGKAADAQDPVGHHVSHEPGGSDPISGVPSVPTPHAASHESEGSDEISIAALSGKAADAQTPLNHGATHGFEGGDDISIGGLSGMPAAAGSALGLATLGADAILTEAQRPPTKTHGNEAHTTALQPTSEKGSASGYCPLGTDSKVPDANLPPGVGSKFIVVDSIPWQSPPITGQGEYLYLDFAALNQMIEGDQLVISAAGIMSNPGDSKFLTLTARIYNGAGFLYSALATMIVPANCENAGWYYQGRISVVGSGSSGASIGSATLIGGAVYACTGDLGPLTWDFTAPLHVKMLIVLTDNEVSLKLNHCSIRRERD